MEFESFTGVEFIVTCIERRDSFFCLRVGTRGLVVIVVIFTRVLRLVVQCGLKRVSSAYECIVLVASDTSGCSVL